MGLINWYKDKRIHEWLMQMKELEANFKVLEAKMKTLETNHNSLRGMLYRKVDKFDHGYTNGQKKGMRDDEMEQLKKELRAYFNADNPLEVDTQPQSIIDDDD